MIRFIRTATVKTSAHVPQAIGWGREVVGYLKKTYDVDVHVGLELFNTTTLYWLFEAPDLNSIHELNGKLLQDRTYTSMLENSKEHWLEGSVLDRVITIIE